MLEFHEQALHLRSTIPRFDDEVELEIWRFPQLTLELFAFRSRAVQRCLGETHLYRVCGLDRRTIATSSMRIDTLIGSVIFA